MWLLFSINQTPVSAKQHMARLIVKHGHQNGTFYEEFELCAPYVLKM
jgi:hypothetical protein